MFIFKDDVQLDSYYFNMPYLQLVKKAYTDMVENVLRTLMFSNIIHSFCYATYCTKCSAFLFTQQMQAVCYVDRM